MTLPPIPVRTTKIEVGLKRADLFTAADTGDGVAVVTPTDTAAADVVGHGEGLIDVNAVG